MRVRKALLVGAFRSMANEGDDGPFGGQGGFVDTLAPAPYSLANGYLKAFAEADPALSGRWRVELLDVVQPLDLEDEDEEVVFAEADADRILERDPDLVGFSAYCWNAGFVREAAAALRRRRPGLRIVVGGRATEGDPEGLLGDMPEVDALVVGEGELPFRELLLRGDGPWDGIRGVVSRAADGTIRSGGSPVHVGALDTIPSPFLSGALRPARDGVMMELSRGCLHACGYCTWNAAKRLRLFGPARVEAEIRWARERGHRHVTVTDSALNYDTAGMGATVAAIRRADPEGSVRFTYNIRHDHVTPEQLEVLAGLPTHMVLLGVETLSPAGMGEVSRAAVDVEALERTLSAVAEAVRPPVVSIVLGLPGDTEDGFRRTLDTLMGWTRPRASGRPLAEAVLVSLLQVYRGSSLWRHRHALGLRVRERGIPYLIESPSWSREALARAKADLAKRMAAEPERLKAAEAVVLMESHGGASPWHTRRRVSELLGEWTAGEGRAGWALEKVGRPRDTGRGVLARFRFEQGGAVRLRFVHRREEARGGGLLSAYYHLYREPVPGPRPPERACRELEEAVLAAVRRGEARLAARAAGARRRS